MTTFNVGDWVYVGSGEDHREINSYEEKYITFPRQIVEISHITGNIKLSECKYYWRSGRFRPALQSQKSLEDYM